MSPQHPHGPTEPPERVRRPRVTTFTLTADDLAAVQDDAPPASARARTETKRPRGRSNAARWTADQKDEALAALRDVGLAGAHESTGIAKSTLRGWALAAGIDTAGPHAEVLQAARDALEERHLVARLEALPLLERHLQEAGAFVQRVVEVNARAADAVARLDPSLIEVTTGPSGPVVTILNREAADLVRRAQALALLPLSVRDAEGIVTRAVHDLQLLRGEATERGELLVVFGDAVPRPDPKLIDHDVVDQDQLGARTP